MRITHALLAVILALTPAAGARQSDDQTEYRALQTMQDSLGPMVASAQQRVALMQRFIGENNLEDAWGRFVPPVAATTTPLTFDQALDAAEKHQRLLAPTPPGKDIQTIGAFHILVQSQWTELNRLHQQVANLSAFLTSQNKLVEYQRWAIDAAMQPPEQQGAPQADNDPGLTAEQVNAQEQRAQYLAGYRQNLDQEQQAQQNTNANPTDNANYTTGSYWNGYADPYFDVYGVNTYHQLPDHLPGPYWWHDVPHPWNRTNGLLRAAPGLMHPAMRMLR